MINFRRTSLVSVFALTALTTVSAQPRIQVEESTGSATQASGRTPIEISIPRSESPNVNVTTSSGQPNAQADDTGSIDLTPAQFRARRATETLPVVTPAPPPLQTPAASAVTTPTAAIMPDHLDPIATPSPVTTNDQVTTDDRATTETTTADPETTMAEAATDPGDPDSYTTSTMPLSGKDVKATTETLDTISWLPPANLGKEKTIQRGAVEVPMVPDLLTPPDLAATIPDVHQTTLTNGMNFYHYESRDLPRVRINLVIDAGQNADPADKVGLAELTARTLRSGGSAGMSADEIDEALDQIGSDLEISVQRDHVAASMFVLTDRLASGTELLAGILMEPAFDAQKFEQQRGRALEELRRQNDNPGEVSRREFRKQVYGADYPLARTPTSATLAAITLDDVRTFYEARYRPSTIWIGLSGDISTDDARQRVETTFAGWDRPAAERVPMPAPLADAASSAGVYLTRKATAQSQIRLGHLGLERRSEDAYAVNVLNSVYGMGGFSSRLMNVVRTQNGFVYGVGGGVLSDDPTGLFLAAASSKPSTTVAAIKAILDVTRKIIAEGITEDELETARRDVIFSFVSEFETGAKIIQTHMLYDFRGYAPDYLKTFPERIRSVTTQQVKDAAAKFLDPDKIIIYVIGNANELDGPLDQLGPVSDWTLEEYSQAPGQ